MALLYNLFPELNFSLQDALYATLILLAHPVLELVILLVVMRPFEVITHALTGNSNCSRNLAFLLKKPVKYFLLFFAK